MTALDSPDPSTQVGVVIYSPGIRRLISSACNTFPHGLEVTPERLERPLKYTFIEHAERNAVYSLVNRSVAKPIDAVMAGTWVACTDCARAIVQSGIRTVIRHNNISDHTPDHWRESIDQADEIMGSAGVDVIDFRGPIQAEPILHNGQKWNPQTLELT
jgi:dCMP deaminase